MLKKKQDPLNQHEQNSCELRETKVACRGLHMAALGLLHIYGTPAHVWVSYSCVFFWAFFLSVGLFVQV